MADACQWITRLGTMIEPPEYCDRDAVEGEDYCAYHLDDDEPEVDDDTKERLRTS